MTLGNFDGIHLGHKEIFRRVRQAAQSINGTSVVFTFVPHPLKVVAPNASPPLLTDFRKKMELIREEGMDVVICSDFTKKFAMLHPRDFAKNFIAEKIGVKEVFVGYDFSFGRGRMGNIDQLKELGTDFGFHVHILPEIRIEGQEVNSTRIRRLVEEGDVEQAERLLGRHYSIAGKVVSGYKTGKGIGFPTANLRTPYELIPDTGVYAVWVGRGSSTMGGVVNIGFNPTFHRNQLSVEVHIFDFYEEIYGQKIEIQFVGRLRDERKFNSAEELVDQIKMDVDQARKILGMFEG